MVSIRPILAVFAVMVAAAASALAARPQAVAAAIAGRAPAGDRLLTETESQLLAVPRVERVVDDRRSGSGQAPSPDPTAAETWSPMVDGLRGRLIATVVQDAGRPQLRLDLELENVSNVANPIEIWWTGLNSMLDFTVEDASGKPVPRISPGGNDVRPQDFSFPLLYQSSIRVVITRNAYYVHPDRVWLRPTTFQAWSIGPLPWAPLFIRGTFTAKKAPQPRERAWQGALALPRIAIPNTPGVVGGQSR